MFAHFGSLIVSQWRYALSRHSRRKAGSPFFCEISRMMSSFSPARTTSEAIVVSNPSLYGWRARASLEVLRTAQDPRPLARRRRAGATRRWGLELPRQVGVVLAEDLARRPPPRLLGEPLQHVGQRPLVLPREQSLPLGAQAVSVGRSAHPALLAPVGDELLGLELFEVMTDRVGRDPQLLGEGLSGERLGPLRLQEDLAPKSFMRGQLRRWGSHARNPTPHTSDCQLNQRRF